VPDVARALEAAPSRSRALVAGAATLLGALAWLYLLRLDAEMQSGVDYARSMAAMGMAVDRPWSAADVLSTFLMWSIMMVAMMTGSALPVLLLFTNATRARGQSVALPLLFGGGYLVVWFAFSAAATGAQLALHEASLLSPTMAANSPRLGGAILVLAGLYQLTPWKSACLSHCRTPLGFLMSRWRDGRIGALRMGARHGVWCVGCCWALMLVLFATGVMNLLWVLAIAGLVLLEKASQGGRVVSCVSGAVMIVAGAVLFARG
jgi:predicted metal-binding membrane protein